MTDERIVLATACTPEYQLPFAVTLQTLLKHVSKKRELVLYLIHSGLCPKLLQLVREMVQLVEVELPWNNERLSHARFSRVATVPIYLDQLVPEQRVLFLDSDLLVLDDIGKLWDEDLRGSWLGAAPDMAITPQAVPSSYFNAGVLLLDLEACRQENLLVEARRRLELNPTRFLHQDVLNELAGGDWRELPLRWNLLGGLCGRAFSHPFKAKVSEAEKNPGIIHFAGKFKPWLFKVGGSFGRAYQKEVRSSPLGQTPTPAGLRNRFLSVYDRLLRRHLYPLERWAWTRNWV